jgi:hypothetical protein
VLTLKKKILISLLVQRRALRPNIKNYWFAPRTISVFGPWSGHYIDRAVPAPVVIAELFIPHVRTRKRPTSTVVVVRRS